MIAALEHFNDIHCTVNTAYLQYMHTLYYGVVYRCDENKRDGTLHHLHFQLDHNFSSSDVLKCKNAKMQMKMEIYRRLCRINTIDQYRVF